MYSGVIFDLDGTILDTLGDLHASVNFALCEKGYPQRTLSEVKSFVGNGIKNLVKLSLPECSSEKTVDETLEIFKKHYSQNMSVRTKPYDGIIEMLEKLKNGGIKLAVVSNKADFAVKELADKYFGGLFDVAIGEREGMERKPNPQSVFEAMEIIGTRKNNTVYVGDMHIDIETAKNAGIDCICVGWGFRDKEFLLSHGGTIVAENTGELLKVILK